MEFVSTLIKTSVFQTKTMKKQPERKQKWIIFIKNGQPLSSNDIPPTHEIVAAKNMKNVSQLIRTTTFLTKNYEKLSEKKKQ